MGFGIPEHLAIKVNRGHIQDSVHLSTWQQLEDFCMQNIGASGYQEYLRPYLLISFICLN